MSLIKAVFDLCKNKLVGNGWDLLFAEHGLDINRPTAANLAEELDQPLAGINRSLVGFEDFALTGNKGIEAGSPAQSLLYHALASPNVLNQPNGLRLSFFPTLKDLEDVENYVFGVKPPTVTELLQRVGAMDLAIVVFAHEYRPASQTCHGVHADLTFARTGIARVGTAAANYRADLRGFLPELPNDPHAICVSPARFAAYLAVKKKGTSTESRPMRFRDARNDEDPPDWVADNQREFWVPVHKLFRGKECLKGTDLKEVAFSAKLVNEKILRIDRFLGGNPPSVPPFRITTGIADFSIVPTHGSGVLVPDVHPLVEEARKPNGQLVTLTVPSGSKPFDTLSPKSPTGSGFRNLPEYVHIRTMIEGGEQVDLNNLADTALTAKLKAGNYDALYYIDFTGDGWVDVMIDCPLLVSDPRVTGKARPAYSLVTAPDFFPSCDQRQLMAWTASNDVPVSIRDSLWGITPNSLCDQRLAPNLQLQNHPFANDDFTMTALVSMADSAPIGAKVATSDALRHAHLPDDAAGVFAPGWDVALDRLKVSSNKFIWHLAAYGLGSPFPEDAKLCAALSTFWPAVAPDATREMEPVTGNQSGTVAPLTDQEIGQVGGLPWDGVVGPQVIVVGGEEFADFANFRHVDYVRNALKGQFTLRLTGRVDAIEYQNRVMAAAVAYLALGFERTGSIIDPGTLREERSRWKVLSFQKVLQGTPELEQAKIQAQVALPGPIYRMELFPEGPLLNVPGSFRRKQIKMVRRFFLFVDPKTREAAVRARSQATWHKGKFIV